MLFDMRTDGDIDPDIAKVQDRGEPVSEMEPLLVGARHRGKLTDLALELALKAAGFRRSLPENIQRSLVDLVRVMNGYYSNLIEGHDTHPIDIERALNNNYSQDRHKRDLQLEAKAHIAVQEWIDLGGLRGRAASADGILEIHRRFCGLLPEDFLWIEDPEKKERVRVVGGETRKQDVLGRTHFAVSAGALPRFMARFAEAYGAANKTDSVLAAATAHHRLLWIHPFLDGNGRVARLLSHAILLESLDTGAVWSVARGLARSVEAYNRHLAACDQPRRNDLDGRGQLSEEALAAFAEFFFGICIDQVDFMEGLVHPDRLRARMRVWAEEEIRLGKLPAKSESILETILFRGELPRRDAASVVSTSDRQARRIVSALLDHGVLTSESPRAPLRLLFPAHLASSWMPGLFPERKAS
jgi:Fic family protein